MRFTDFAPTSDSSTTVPGKEAEFDAFVAKELTDLSKAAFGEPLLHAIGNTYALVAQK